MRSTATNPKLNDRQRRFAENLVGGMSAVQAYTEAGYTATEGAARTGAKDLQRLPHVAAHIEKLRAAAANAAMTATGLTKAWVVERLRQNVERAMQAEPVLDRDGAPTGEYRYEGSVANRALELLGKELGMFGDKVKIEVVDVSELTDEELLAIAHSGGAG